MVRKRFRLGFVLFVGLAVFATPALANDLVDVDLGPSGLYLSGKTQEEGWVLTISAPDGKVHRMQFGAGETPVYPVSPEMADGSYFWEVTPIAAPRTRGEDRALASEARRAQSGTFRILDGAIVTGGQELSAPATRARGQVDTRGGFQTKDQQILDDLIVDGSACVGFDCVNGESFGSDTIRLKENNVRLHFDDTSNTASFPSNDWRLTANDQTNGGANKFSIDDATAGRSPFTIEAGAPSHSLYVEDGGRIGFGTSTPVVDLHVKSGNTPTLRLEQDGSSGFAAQTYDVAANEANFFIRDVTNGSKLFFRAQPNAPQDSLFIANDGDIGMGTNSPATPLEIRETSAANRTMLQVTNNGTTRIAIADTRATGTTWFNSVNEAIYTVSLQGSNGPELELRSDGTFIVGPGGIDNLTLDSAGNLTTVGMVNGMSDRNRKTAFETVSAKEILARVTDLPLAEWTYKADAEGIRHFGPMAQDFYGMFGLGIDDKHIAAADLSGVALAAIQGLDAKLAEKETEIERLSESNGVLEARNAELAARLAALEAAVAALTDAQD